MERVVSVVAFFCYSVAYVTVVVANSEQGSELHILLMTSSSQRFNSSGAESAVQLAVDRINSDTSILPGYELDVAGVRNTKVNTLCTIIV